MKHLRAKDLTIPPKSGVYWVDAALTDRVAVWAVDTTNRMFAELTRLLGREADRDWGWR
jgi:hypothetical protein